MRPAGRHSGVSLSPRGRRGAIPLLARDSDPPAPPARPRWYLAHMGLRLVWVLVVLLLSSCGVPVGVVVLVGVGGREVAVLGGVRRGCEPVAHGTSGDFERAGVMSAESVAVAGRFEPGGHVSLWLVADERVQRHEGGELVETRRADEVGSVVFTGKRVVVGARYIAFGYVGGRPESVRCSTADGVLSQAPVAPAVVKHADGQVVAGEYVPLRDEVPVEVPVAKRKRPSRAKKKAGVADSAAAKKPAAKTSAAKPAAPKTTARRPAGGKRPAKAGKE